MGKTKTKIIDDSIQEEPKKASVKVKKSAKSESVQVNGTALQAENPVRGDGEEGPLGRARKQAEKDPRETEPAGPRMEENEQAPKVKSQKQGKSKPRSKKYQEVVKDLDRSATYAVDEAVDMVKKLSYSKFNGTLEAHIVTAQTGLRGLISLPFASGRKIRVLAFGRNAPSSGADIVGADSTISEIEKGKINFDIIVTTPEWMPKLAKLAKILGPKGLMPNPKNGTITDDLKKAVREFQGDKTKYEHSSKILYKTEGKVPVIHLSLGKLNQPTPELSANIKALLQTLGKFKVLKVNLAPTMGPSVKLNLSSL